MADSNAIESFFDFEAATDNDLANDVESGNPRVLARYPPPQSDQHPQAQSTVSTQPIQGADQWAAIPDPSPAMAPLPPTEMQQQWPALFPMGQTMGTDPFAYGQYTAPYPPNLQQQQGTIPHANFQHYQPGAAPASQSMGFTPQATFQQWQPGPAVASQSTGFMPQANFQQWQPGPAPASQSMGLIPDFGKAPPAHCHAHTMMFQECVALIRQSHSYSMDESLEPRPNINAGPSAPFSPTTQQQGAPLPQDALSQRLQPGQYMQPASPLPQDLRPLPTGPSTWSPQITPLAPPPVQQHQQHFNHASLPTQQHQESFPLPTQQQQQQESFPLPTPQQATSPFPTPPKSPSTTLNLAPITAAATATTTTNTNTNTNTNAKSPSTKGRKPTGVAKKPARPPGRKPKDHDKVGFVNATVPASEHFDTTKYGRNSLRGAGSEARLAEPWNQPSVKGKGKGKGKGKAGDDESPPVAEDAVVVQEPAKEGPVGEDESARAPVAEIAGPEEEEEEEAGMMELEEEMLKFDDEIGDLDIDALLDSEDYAS
ncbi:MAG: hypothetical protein ASARMPREDX12_002929 [Alectoria sarmentosa]|nr:MAG: hypothetical protein ASARMPREDX12_002929 [Alectoria sarmentosa]